MDDVTMLGQRRDLQTKTRRESKSKASQLSPLPLLVLALLCLHGLSFLLSYWHMAELAHVHNPYAAGYVHVHLDADADAPTGVQSPRSHDDGQHSCFLAEQALQSVQALPSFAPLQWQSFLLNQSLQPRLQKLEALYLAHRLLCVAPKQSPPLALG